MTVSDVSEPVELTAQPAGISATEATLGDVVDERRAMELPLFAGNARDLVQLATGALNGANLLRLPTAPFNNRRRSFQPMAAATASTNVSADGVAKIYPDGTRPRALCFRASGIQDPDHAR